MDFAGEVERCLLVLDGVILVVSAVEGVQSHTENLWNALDKLKMPSLIFINKIDRPGSRFDELLDSFPRELAGGRRFFALNRPTGEAGAGCGIVSEKALYENMAEAAAEADDDFMREYLTSDDLPPERIKAAFCECVRGRRIIPVLCGSAKLGIGTRELLDAAGEYLPAADEKSIDGLSAYVFKIEHDEVMGKVAHVRMFGGELNVRDTVTPYRKEDADTDRAGDKIAQIRLFSGQKYRDAGSVGTGDIAALCGLRSFRVGDYIGKARFDDDFRLANPFLSVKVIPKKPEDLTPLIGAVAELTEEDPLLSCKWEKTEREILINITGEIQLEVISALLRERYNLEAGFSAPSVIYKETPAGTGYGFEAYTMPKPCWAVVKLLFEPLPRGSGVVYDGGHIPHNKLFYKYQTHIRRSFFESLGQGMYGWEVTDFRATLVDGEHHTIHTHPLDFFVATPMAVMNGLSNTGTILLEPYLRFRISADEAFTGKIINDVIMMRGEFDTPVTRKDAVTIEASIPVATSLDYPVRLASMTGGKATFYMNFDGYRPCPPELGQIAPRRGINPLDRSKWILAARGAMRNDI